MKRFIALLLTIAFVLIAVPSHAVYVVNADGSSSGVTTVRGKVGIWTTFNGVSKFTTFGGDNLVAAFSAEDLLIENAQFTREFHRDGNATTDHVLCGGESGTTTGWTAVDFGAGGIFDGQSSVVDEGSFAFRADNNITANGNARIHYDLATLSLTDGNKYTVSFRARHIGTGGNWQGVLNNSNSIATPTVDFVTLTSSDNTFQSYSAEIIYSSDYRYMVFGEIGATNDGGVYVDNIRIYEHDPSFNIGLGSVLQSGDTAYYVRSSGGTGYGAEANTTDNALRDYGSSDSGTTTGWGSAFLNSGNSFYASSSVKANGTHSYCINANVTPNPAVRATDNLASGYGLITDNRYRLMIKARHIGTGGAWDIGLAEGNTTIETHIADGISNTETTFSNYSIDFTYEGGDYYLICREDSVTNDGGLYIDALSIKPITPDSLLVHAGGNQPRVERFANIDGAGINSAVSNYCLDNTDLSTGNWTKTRSFVTGQGTAPDGTERAFFLAADGSNNTHLIKQSIANAVLTDNAMVTFSVFAQASTLDWIWVRPETKDGTRPDVYFNVSSGTIGQQSGVSSAYISKDTINGFYRCSVTYMVESGSDVMAFAVYLSESDGDSGSFQNDGSGVTIAFPQITEHPSAMPVLMTEGSVAVNTGNSGGIAWDIPSIRVDASGASTTTLFAEDLSGGLVVDGGFDGSCGVEWTCGGAWTVSGSSAYFDDSGANAISQTLSNTVPANSLVKITFTVSNGSGAARIGWYNGSEFLLDIGYYTDDTHTVYGTNTSSFNEIQIYGYTAGGSFNIDGVSITHVQSAYNSGPTSSGGLWPNHGTAVVQLRFGASEAIWDYPQNVSVLDLNTSTASLFYPRKTGSGTATIKTYDGTNDCALAWNWREGKWYTFIIEWGALDSNVNKYRLGVLLSSGISWSGWFDFDGAYAEGSSFRLGYNMYNEMWISKLILLRGHLPASFYQMMGY